MGVEDPSGPDFDAVHRVPVPRNGHSVAIAFLQNQQVVGKNDHSVAIRSLGNRLVRPVSREILSAMRRVQEGEFWRSLKRRENRFSNSRESAFAKHRMWTGRSL